MFKKNFDRLAEPPDIAAPDPGTLFRRHLPQPTIEDDAEARQRIVADYARLLAQLNDGIVQFRDHLGFHEVEFSAVAGADGRARQARLYVADLSCWLRALRDLTQDHAPASGPWPERPASGVELLRGLP